MKWFFALSLSVLAVCSSYADTLTPKDPQDLFIRFNSNLSENQQTLLLAEQGLQIEWRSSLVPGLVRAKLHAGVATAALLNRASRTLSAQDGVRYAEPNYRIHRKLDRAPSASKVAVPRSFAGPTDPMLNRQWALTTANGVNPAGAWEKTTGSRDVRVAILDTGIQSDHPELSDRVLPGYDFIGKDSDPSDSHGHGTHVSGIIGARWDNGEGIAGINKDVTFIPIRVVPDNGDETDADLVEAFEFAAKEGARVANCSFGKSQSGQAVRDVIEATGQKGMLVVVAAGNSMADLGRRPSYPASFQTSNMIVVGSTTEKGHLSYFSNYSGSRVHVAAPGSAILSTINGSRYASWDGTSMAAPQVAGVAALALAANPGLTPFQLRDILKDSVSRRSTLEGKIVTSGLIDASAAVLKALQ